ncbi:restriction endonuclease subunit S [Acinetobacter schindleri]|uniref:restriction endonuclease subunit S n=1 Tax=Acinetobacter schindleri TaxID=108981 RepID=UPI003CFF6215
MMFEKYDAYKDSGVEWLARIPANWSCIKMKFLYSDVSIKGRENAELLSVTQDRGVIPRAWVENRMVMPSGNLESFKYIQKGDFAISLRSFEGGLEYCYHDGIISPAYTVLKKKRNDLKEGYYKYLFKSKIFISELQTSIVGIREGKNISYEELRYSYLPIPSGTEQNKISCFLDQKTSEIDQAIAIKEQQIALLNERKQIVIQKAVTQGLDPNVPMKDSGLNGVGNIPQDWEIIKFKYLAKVRYGLGQPPRQLDNGLKIIRATNIERGKIVEKGMLYIDPNDIPWDRNPTLNKDEIIVVRSGAYTGDSAIVTEEYAGCIAGYDMVATPFNCYPKFLSTVLLSHYVLYEQIYLLRMRSAQPHLNAEELNELKIVVPPINQQRLIANYIEKVESDIGEAISLIKQQLEKLKEYKTTLINDAVTGKIKVA